MHDFTKVFKYQLGTYNSVMWQTITMVVLLINYSSAECNVCQTNYAACTNSSSFYMCFDDNVTDTSVLYHCPDGLACTEFTAICAQSSPQRPPSCGDTSLCGMCSAHRNYLFACLSRTRFQMCYGDSRTTGAIYLCPAGLVCYAGSDAVCVLEETIERVTCDIVYDGGMTTLSTSTTSPMSPIPPTSPMSTTSPMSPTPPTTTTEATAIEILTPSEICEQQRSMGLFPTIPNDPFCKRYISCYISNGILMGREYSCWSGTYYHMQQEKCVFNKPTYCL